jgi:hypothetical protein
VRLVGVRQHETERGSGGFAGVRPGPSSGQCGRRLVGGAASAGGGWTLDWAGGSCPAKLSAQTCSSVVCTEYSSSSGGRWCWAGTEGQK